MSATSKVPQASLLTSTPAKQDLPSPALRQLIYSLMQDSKFDGDTQSFICVTPKGTFVTIPWDMKFYDAFVKLKQVLDAEHTKLGYRNALKVQSARSPGQMQLNMYH